MADVKIRVALDDKKARSGFKSLTQQFVGNAHKINASLEIVGRAFSAVTGAVGKMTAIVNVAVKASQEQERAERGLRAALDLRGAATGAVFKRVQAFNAQIQRSLGFGDEQLLQLQKQLLAMGVQETHLESATRATIGLAEATGQNLQSASRIAARALTGQVSALTRYGVRAADAADAQAQLNELFKIAQGQSGTLETKLRALSAAVGDTHEELGAAFTQSTALKTVVDGLTDLVVEFTNILASDEGRQAINSFFGFLAESAATAASAIVAAADALTELRGGETVAQRRAAREELFQATVQANIAQGRTPDIQVIRAFVERQIPFVAREVIQNFADTMLRASREPFEGFTIQRRSRVGGAPGAGPGGAPIEAPGAIGETAGGFGSAFFGADPLSEATKLAEKLQTIDEERLASKAAFSAGLREWEAAETDATGAFYGQLAAIAGAGISSLVSTTVSGLIQGNLTIEKALGALFGTLLSGVGQSMVALGSAALAAASATSVIPILWPIFGGPIGIGGAIGLITAGSALVGVGQSMGSLTAGASSEIKSTAAAGVARHGGAAAPPRGGGGFFGGPTAPSSSRSDAVPARVVNVSFNNALPGSERRMAREIKRILNAGDLGLAAG